MVALQNVREPSLKQAAHVFPAHSAGHSGDEDTLMLTDAELMFLSDYQSGLAPHATSSPEL